MQQHLALLMTALFLMLTGSAYAHTGVMPHPETTSELAHLAAHALMTLPVVVGAWLLGWGAKRLLAKRTAQKPRG